MAQLLEISGLGGRPRKRLGGTEGPTHDQRKSLKEQARQTAAALQRNRRAARAINPTILAEFRAARAAFKANISPEAFHRLAVANGAVVRALDGRQPSGVPRHEMGVGAFTVTAPYALPGGGGPSPMLPISTFVSMSGEDCLGVAEKCFRAQRYTCAYTWASEAAKKGKGVTRQKARALRTRVERGALAGLI